MLAMTRGPSMKPACAATKSSAASEKSTVTLKILPSGSAPRCQPPASFSTSSAFIVFQQVSFSWQPGTGRTSKSR